MSKAIGLMLTICGLILGWFVVQVVTQSSLPPLSVFIIAAIALAMLSVGVRYLLKRKPGGKQEKGPG